MSEESKAQIKAPTKAGLHEARRRLKDLRRKEPSSELVKIIDEVTREPADKKSENDSDGIAAKQRPRDVEL